MPVEPQASDHALMARIAAGDRDAFATLVHRHQQAVLALAYRFLGRWDLAEDIGQEAFIRIWSGARRYEPRAEFRTWLYRVVANLCWDQRRRRGTALAPLRDECSTGMTDAALPSEQAELGERVRQAIGELPDRQRLALVLHRYDGLPHQAIAEITGWTAAAVESCLVRAYEHLRNSLSAKELE
jgi:RNA polymerase sigma-70 factor, ECF subfamily